MIIKMVINTCYGVFGLSAKAKTWMKERGYDTEANYPIPRDLPLLVECVETLGSEEASGECAELEVVEVKVNLEISSFDGNESVEGYVHQI